MKTYNLTKSELIVLSTIMHLPTLELTSKSITMVEVMIEGKTCRLSGDAARVLFDMVNDSTC